MNKLFTVITDRLDKEAFLRWVDLDKGQLSVPPGTRPAVAFPCALVRVSFPRIDSLGDDLDDRHAQIIIRLAFDDAAGRTATAAPEQARAQSLAYLEQADCLYRQLRVFEPDDWSRFACTEMVQEERSDALVVMRMRFSTNRID